MRGRSATRRFSGVLLALLLSATGLAALLAGCGGGEDRTVATTSLAKAEYVKRADAICARGRMRALRYQPSLGREGQTPAAAHTAIEVSVLPAIREVVDELYELGAPSGQKGQVEAFLAAFQEGVDEAEGLEVPTFDRLQRVLGRPGELALKAELRNCVFGE